MRRAAKVDNNQSAIVSAVRSCGAFVQSLAAIGKGCPDLLVIYKGRVAVWEIKDGAKAKSGRKLTGPETKWHDDCLRVGKYFVPVVESVEQAVGILNGAENSV